MHTTPPLLSRFATPLDPISAQISPLNHSHFGLSSVKFSPFFRFLIVGKSDEFSLTLTYSSFETVTKFGFSLRKM
jgi:hypothetical protein